MPTNGDLYFHTHEVCPEPESNQRFSSDKVCKNLCSFSVKTMMQLVLQSKRNLPPFFLLPVPAAPYTLSHIPALHEKHPAFYEPFGCSFLLPKYTLLLSEVQSILPPDEQMLVQSIPLPSQALSAPGYPAEKYSRENHALPPLKQMDVVQHYKRNLFFYVKSQIYRNGCFVHTGKSKICFDIIDSINWSTLKLI